MIRLPDIHGHAASDEGADELMRLHFDGDFDDALLVHAGTGSGDHLACEADVRRLQAEKAARFLPRGDVAFIDLAAFLDDDAAVAHLLHFTEQVGVQHDGDAVFFAQEEDALAKLENALGIEAVGGLVEQQNARPGHERLCEGETLAHAVAVGAGFLMNGLRKADHLDDAARLGLIPPAGEGAEDAQVLPAAQVVVKTGRFVDGADLAERAGAVFLHAAAADAHLAGIRAHHAEGDAHDGALSRAIVTEEAEDFALAHLKAHVIQREAAGGPALGEAFEVEEGHAGASWTLCALDQDRDG